MLRIARIKGEDEPAVYHVLHIFTFMKNHKTVPTWQAKYENVKNAILR